MTTSYPNTWLAIPFLRASGGILSFWISDNETLDLSIADLGLATVSSIVMFQEGSNITIDPGFINWELYLSVTPVSTDYTLVSSSTYGTAKSTIANLVGSSAAPLTATYVLLSSNSSLVNSAVLAAGAGLTLSTATFAVDFTAVQAKNATLTSIALLGSAADKTIYTTGINTWAETSLPSFGRSLIAAANAATAQSTLGLGTMATQNASSVAITGGSVTNLTTLSTTAGSNTLDVSLAGQNYLSITNQTITANAVDLSGSNATGVLAAARHPALTGDVTTSSGAIVTTLASNVVTYAKFQQVAASSLVGNATGSFANATGITLGATLTFSGSALQTVAHTGDVTTSANSFATTITNSAVTNAKMANMANNTVKGNISGSSAAPSDLTATQLTALVNSFTSSLSGAAPASGGGTTNFLRADGNWVAPPGGGGGGGAPLTSTYLVLSNDLLLVNDRTATAGTGITITDNGAQSTATFAIDIAWVGQTALTTLGTIVTGIWHGTAISEVYGGTNQTSYTLGDLLYSSAANTLSKLAGNTTTTVKFLSQTGNGTASAAPAWSTIDLSTGSVTGTLAAGRFPALTGDVTNSAGALATTIATSAVTNAKMANVANNTVKGNVSGGSAAPTDLTATQLTTLVNTFTSSLSGAAPSSGGGTTNFLRADGTWTAPATSETWTHIFKTSDTSRNTTTTLTIDPDLQFSMSANKTYVIKFSVFFTSSSSTPVWKFDLTGPTSPTAINGVGTYIDSSSSITLYTAFNTQILGTTSATNGASHVELTVENGANSGTFGIRWAQKTSNGTNSVLQAGSYISYKQVN